ncbi:MAG: diguanylate cyclase [Candidatus Magnetoovum sp. WYHC-5]|nr:diguanylate cyclase [Candidatus Magnetoovum sp. WYHC-5]
MNSPNNDYAAMQVLIVDDTPDNLELAKAFLEEEGFYNIKEAFNVKEARKVLVEENIDLILLDIMMPEIDGITACKEFKSNDRLKSIPIIMITAKVDTETLKNCFDAGANDYIRKPINDVEFIARVKSALKLKRETDLNREMSLTDPLTGLYNRRSMEIFFKRELERAKRERRYIAFMMLDIDFFKQYNDNYGHQAGDEAIKQVATILKQHFKRPGDYVFRMGGEEFGALFVGLDVQQSLNFVENIRKKIAVLNIEHAKSNISDVLTVSIGINVAFGDNGITEDIMIKKADDALYKAKGEGRNRVAIC